MKKKYDYKPIYSKCSRCQLPKEPSRTPYHNECFNEYMRSRLENQIEITYSYDDIDRFRQHIIHNHHLVDLNELMTIILIYREITNNLNEYDNLSSGKQIMKMWEKILKLDQKDIKIMKPIKDIKTRVKLTDQEKEDKKRKASREWYQANKEKVKSKNNYDSEYQRRYREFQKLKKTEYTINDF